MPAHRKSRTSRTALKKSKAGKLIIPNPAPRPRKVWVTFQLDITLRNEASKYCDKLNLNQSKFLRKQLERLVLAGKMGKIPKDAYELLDLPAKAEVVLPAVVKDVQAVQ